MYLKSILKNLKTNGKLNLLLLIVLFFAQSIEMRWFPGASIIFCIKCFDFTMLPYGPLFAVFGAVICVVILTFACSYYVQQSFHQYPELQNSFKIYKLSQYIKIGIFLVVFYFVILILNELVFSLFLITSVFKFYTAVWFGVKFIEGIIIVFKYAVIFLVIAAIIKSIEASNLHLMRNCIDKRWVGLFGGIAFIRTIIIYIINKTLALASVHNSEGGGEMVDLPPDLPVLAMGNVILSNVIIIIDVLIAVLIFTALIEKIRQNASIDKSGEKIIEE